MNCAEKNRSSIQRPTEVKQESKSKNTYSLAEIISTIVLEAVEIELNDDKMIHELKPLF